LKNKEKIISIIILVASFSLFSMIANSEAPVIVAAIKYYHSSFSTISDLPVLRGILNLFISFFVFSIIIKMGYKKALIFGILIIGLSCLLIPIFNNFISLIILFGMVGAIFGITKISIYSLVTAVAETRKEHASYLNLLEGFFMLGLVATYFLFGWFINFGNPGWTYVYYIYAALAVIMVFVLIFLKIDETKIQSKNTKPINEYKKMPQILCMPVPLILLIVVGLYASIDSILFEWIPSIYKYGIHMSATKSIDIAAFIALFYAIGRIIGAYFIKSVRWSIYLLATMTLAVIYMAFIIILFKTSSLKASFFDSSILAAYLLPAIGLFTGPIAPLLSSLTIKSVKSHFTGSIMVLIIIFSAIISMISQKAFGSLMSDIGPIEAFEYLLYPFVLLWIIFFILNLFHKQISNPTIKKPAFTGRGINSKEFEIATKRFVKGEKTQEIFTAIKNGYKTRDKSTICIDDIELLRIKPRIKWVIEKLKQQEFEFDSKILDAGSWTGAFANEIYKAGYHNITCLDLAKSVCKMGADSFPHLKYINDDIETFIPESKYDVVLLCELVEHLVTPFETIERIRKHFLNDGGVILTTIPDEEYVSEDFKEERYEHIYPITRSELKDLAYGPIDEIPITKSYTWYCVVIKK